MPITTPISSKIKKLKHAGIRNSFRVLKKRLTKKILHLPILSKSYQKHVTLNMDDLKNALQISTINEKELYKKCFKDKSVKYFLDDAEKTCETIKTFFPESVERCIENADLISNKKFTLLGIGVFFDDKINWHWCPENGKSWKIAPSSYYKGPGNYYRDDRPGDVRYPWELSRHQYLFTLAKAYKYTNDEKYAQIATDILTAWIEDNPYGFGLHWVSTMEASIRLISWINTSWLICDSPYFIEKGIIPFLLGVLQHASHIEKHLTDDWLVPTNHIIGELAGLMIFSTLFPQFKSSRRIQAKTIKIIEREIKSQVYSDGVIREQSTGYHRFNVDFILLIFRLAEMNNVQVAPIIKDRLFDMLKYQYHLTTPDKKVPIICDCDDGRGYVLSEGLEFNDYSSWQAVGAILFNYNNFASNAGAANEEAVWFLGSNNWKKFISIPKNEMNHKSILFKEGGQAILRSGKPSSQNYLHLRCGSFGLGGDGTCSHSHADMLSMIIYWRGEQISVDNGVYKYFGPEKYRKLFRSTRIHNTVAPKGVDQAEMHKIMDWSKVPVTKITEWKQTEFETLFTALMYSYNGYTHQRKIRLSDSKMIISDNVNVYDQSLVDLPIEWRLHLSLGITAKIIDQNNKVILYNSNDKPIAKLEYSGFDYCCLENSLHSPSYGIITDSKCICLVRQDSTLSSICTLTDP